MNVAFPEHHFARALSGTETWLSRETCRFLRGGELYNAIIKVGLRVLANRMIFFRNGSLDYATEQFIEHYHTERPHQGLGNKLIVSMANPPPDDGEVVVTERLGGLLKSYHRAA